MRRAVPNQAVSRRSWGASSPLAYGTLASPASQPASSAPLCPISAGTGFFQANRFTSFLFFETNKKKTTKNQNHLGVGGCFACLPLKNNVTRRRWPHLRVYEALACPLLIPCTGGGSFHLALVQPNIQWPKGEKGVGSRTGTSGAELSNNKMQSFRENASNGWRRKSRVQRAPRCQRGGRQAPKCPVMHLVAFWKQEKNLREAKPTTGLNPGQLHPQQNLLLCCGQGGFQSLMQ